MGLSWWDDLPTKLRRKAEQLRRLANIATSGGHNADRRLRMLADDFDRQAEGLERLVEFEEAGTR